VETIARRHGEQREPPALVAHRGYALRFPENTIESLASAMEAGARFVEFDVQLTADGVPVLLHDVSLQRTAGVDARVMELPLARLKMFEANETGRLGDSFTGVRVPTLQEAMRLLCEWPHVTAFVEIKHESLEYFGREFVVRRLLGDLALRPAGSVVISFDEEALMLARERGARSIGWVLHEWSAAVRRAAEGLAPAYLFCDYKLIPESDVLWPGPWQWALYDVSDPALALALGARGAHLIETTAVKEMLDHPLFARADES
jgi:glycerophosphoryl diester phosphodiesterase